MSSVCAPLLMFGRKSTNLANQTAKWASMPKTFCKDAKLSFCSRIGALSVTNGSKNKPMQTVVHIAQVLRNRCCHSIQTKLTICWSIWH